jgi:hypothetical protein
MGVVFWDVTPCTVLDTVGLLYTDPSLSLSLSLFDVYGASDHIRVMTFSIEASRSHSDTPHSVESLWTSDQPDAETST